MTARQTRRRFLAGSLGAAGALAALGPTGCARAAAQPSENAMTTATVGEGKYQGLTNQPIQQAVDDVAAAGGGTVVVPPGVYAMHDALHLRSGVRVLGRRGTVLRKVPSQTSRIPAFLGYGHYELIVEEPEKFPVGTGVHILDDNAGGFYTTVATVLQRKGNLLLVNRMLNHDYHAAKNARVVSVYPLVEAADVHDVTLEDIALDGNAGEETFELNGCRGGGIFAIGSARVAFRRVEVFAYRGDGISFQQCADVLVDTCHVHHNVGTGLHPGSGTVRYVMQDNHVHENGRCGIFYCLRTTHSICRANNLTANGEAGISIGERDSDHLLQKNHVAGNGLEGILFRGFTYEGGDRVVVVGNTIGPNGTKKDRPEIALPGGLADVHVLDNTISPGHGKAVAAGKGCRRVSFAGNTIGDRPQNDTDLAAAGGEIDARRPARLPEVGPAALPLDGARHLAIPQLDPWREWWK